MNDYGLPGLASMREYGKVAVLMGGTSAEREVSLLSGKAVLDALLAAGVDAHGVDADRDVLDILKQGGYARAFIVLHGRGGEDGVIQGALQTLGMPYTGSGVLGSALSMDKSRCKQIWRAAGVPTPPSRMLNADSDFDAVAEDLGLPLIVKPVHEGSTIGMSKVSEARDLPGAYAQAREYDALVFAEKWVAGEEYTVAILGERCLPIIRVETPGGWYDYHAKYEADTTQYLCPCGLDDETEAHYGQLALQAFRALGASGWGRVDFMRDADGQAWFIDANTVPGMTSHSLVPMAAKAAGMDMRELVVNILATSLSPRV